MAREVDILGMLEQNLPQVLNLIRKTGDRVIVFDSIGQPFVLMNLDEYQRLVSGRESVADLTEEQLLDKINRDIAVWKTKEEANNIDEFEPAREEYGLSDKEEGRPPASLSQPWTEDEFDWGEDEEDEQEDTYYLEKV